MIGFTRDHVIVIISFFTNGWTQNCINSLLKYVPDCVILAVDNNPSAKDSEERRCSFEKITSRLAHAYRCRSRSWNRFCEIERDWLSSHPRVILTQTNRCLLHGEAIEWAVRWCASHNVRKMVHIEPDCIITSRRWLDNLLAASNTGVWMAGGTRYPSGEFHPTPTIWIVKEAQRLTFTPCLKGEDENHPRFSTLFNMSLARGYHRVGWDTGLKAWFDCAKEDKAAYVPCPGLRHVWNGSIKPSPDRTALFL